MKRENNPHGAEAKEGRDAIELYERLADRYQDEDPTFSELCRQLAEKLRNDP